MNEEKFCQSCGDRIRGRSDKRFCNDYCRSTFNNKRYERKREIAENKLLAYIEKDQLNVTRDKFFDSPEVIEIFNKLKRRKIPQPWLGDMLMELFDKAYSIIHEDSKKIFHDFINRKIQKNEKVSVDLRSTDHVSVREGANGSATTPTLLHQGI